MQGWGHTARANLWITERMDREASAGPTPTLLKAMCRPPAAFSSWIPEGDGCNSLTQGALKLQCTRKFHWNEPEELSEPQHREQSALLMKPLQPIPGNALPPETSLLLTPPFSSQPRVMFC